MFAFFDYVSSLISFIWEIVQSCLGGVKTILGVFHVLFGFFVDVVAYIPDFAEPFILSILAVSIITIFVGKFLNLV